MSSDYKISDLPVRASPAAGDYIPLLVPSDTVTAPAGPGGSDQRATVGSVVIAFAVALGG